MGFSQGAALALWASLLAKQPPAGVAAMSGVLTPHQDAIPTDGFAEPSGSTVVDRLFQRIGNIKM